MSTATSPGEQGALWLVGVKGIQAQGTQEGSTWSVPVQLHVKDRAWQGSRFPVPVPASHPACPSGKEASLGWSSPDSLGSLPWFCFLFLFCS